MTIEYYLVTLYIVIGILISFHYRMTEKDDSVLRAVLTGIIWPLYVLFYVIYGFVGGDE